MKADKEIKPIYLTYKQRATLSVYILMTTQYRENEISTWNKLSEEVKDDGTPKFIHAKSNIKFWKKMHENLEVIRNIIEEN